jgi:hypothetical protein
VESPWKTWGISNPSKPRVTAPTQNKAGRFRLPELLPELGGDEALPVVLDRVFDWKEVGVD